MEKLEAVKLANILMEHYKMPVARRGMFDSYVATDDAGKDYLVIAAGSTGLKIDIETVEVVHKFKRSNFVIEEEFGERQLDLLSIKEDFED